MTKEDAEIDKADEIRKAGLYVGPLILGSIMANGVYHLICEGTSFSINSGTIESVFWNVPFLVGAAYLAWRLREPFGRIAVVVVGIQQALLIWAEVGRVSADRMVVGALGLAFGVLFTLSGLRYRQRQSILKACGVFVAMFVFSWVTRNYADSLIGRDSVLRPTLICSLQRRELAV